MSWLFKTLSFSTRSSHIEDSSSQAEIPLDSDTANLPALPYSAQRTNFPMSTTLQMGPPSQFQDSKGTVRDPIASSCNDVLPEIHQRESDRLSDPWTEHTMRRSSALNITLRRVSQGNRDVQKLPLKHKQTLLEMSAQSLWGTGHYSGLSTQYIKSLLTGRELEEIQESVDGE